MPIKRFLRVWMFLLSLIITVMVLSHVKVTPEQFMIVVGATGLVTVALSYPVKRPC